MKKAFIVIEAILYVAFVLLELKYGFNKLVLSLHFISILGTIIYVLSRSKKEYDQWDLFVVKCIYLVLLPTDIICEFTTLLLAGVIGYLIINLLYAYRMRKTLKHFSFIPFVGAIIIAMAAKMGLELNAVVCIGIIYYICFVTNAISVWLCSKNRLFQIGLTLFFLSDVHVFLQKINGMIKLTGDLLYYVNHYVDLMIWVFFVPAQVVIALSIQRKHQKS